MDRVESPLVAAAAKALGLPAKLIPKTLRLLESEGSTPEVYSLLSGKEPFTTDPVWEKELAHLVKVLETAKIKLFNSPELSQQEATAFAKTNLQKIVSNPENLTAVHQASLCLLMLADVHPEVAAVINLEPVQHNILKKYPTDDFLQVGANRLLNLSEELIPLTAVETKFEYPPFQKALPYYPSFGNQVTMVLDDGATLTTEVQTKLFGLVQKLNDLCASIDRKYKTSEEATGRKECHAGYNIGFEPNTWTSWCKLLKKDVSKPVEESVALVDSEANQNFLIDHPKLRYTKAHVWLYLKAGTQEDCDRLLKCVQDYVSSENIPAKLLTTSAYKKNDGKLFGGQFQDGVTNAIDAMSMIREVLLPTMPTTMNQVDPAGGTFVFVQFFQFDNSAIQRNSQPMTEYLIGRDSTYSETLAVLDERCHIKRARVISQVDGSNTEILRQSLPYTPCKGSKGPEEEGLFFVAFVQSIQRIFDILKNLLGNPNASFVDDLFLTHVQGRFGGLYYCPNTNELSALPQFTEKDLYPVIPFWMSYKSTNPLLFYNHIQYLYTMTTDQYSCQNLINGKTELCNDPPSKRILHLMSRVFSRWHSTWYHKFDVPRLPHLKMFLRKHEQHIMEEPLQVRKGYSYKKMLGEIFTRNVPLPGPDGKIYGHSENFDTYRIFPKELIVGVTDRLSFGSGKEVMPYIKEGAERSLSYDITLTEAGNMGHIVPGHHYILQMGVAGMLEKLLQKSKQENLTEDQKLFYQSALYSYEGVQLYLLNYSDLARKTAQQMKLNTAQELDRKHLREIAKRMVRLASDDPSTFTFHDAVQLIFSMHCCLHLVGQAVSVGRVDQLLINYYQRDIEAGILTPEKAQEIIDAFFIKFDEHVVLNRYNIPYGHTTYGSTCVTGRGGPFPTGDSLNQWIQQITIGGCNAQGEDLCNEVTLMCLKACRRLPLNAPCVSLRLSKDTPAEIKKEAALAILSGGAHPILFNDAKTVQGLFDVLEKSFMMSKLPVPDDLMHVACDYSCDGCYEPMFTGRSEFKFAYVFPLHAIMYSLNSGADYQLAGPLHLAGGVSSYRTPLPQDIKRFDDFKAIFLDHLKLLVKNLYGLILNAYGNPWKICPSPLLSCLLEGCIDSGKDMTNGGSRFHILTPMFVGFTNTVNSLYNIKKMVFDENNVVSLDVLRMALMNNWGEGMAEPFFDTVGEGVIHTQMSSLRFQDLRDYALSLPKFGTSSATEEVYDIAEWLACNMHEIAYNVLYEKGPINDKYTQLRQQHDVEGKPFLFQVMTGCGTFEGYVGIGAACAATPDGRLNGQPTASDISAQPYPQDRNVPAERSPMDLTSTLKPHNKRELHKHFENGCEIDVNIPEDFPFEELVDFIDAFSKGQTGTNLVTITCVDTNTMEQARLEPQKFDLVRNRMGGWTNFFVAMFDEHQKQHLRRPIFDTAKST